MKPKILNLLSDERMGGVKTSLNSLMNSRLQEKFEFAIAPLNRARASIKNLQPEIIIVHDACSWKILPSLLALKFIKGKAKLVILDHHYSEAFERLKVANSLRFRLMLKLCHWCSDRLMLVSHAQGLWMRKYKLVRSPKLTIIQQSLNCDRFLELPPKPISKPLTFAAYGRFEEQKGFDILLTQRENRLHVMALANGLQVSIDNVLTIILAFLGWGMWAIVLPKVIVAPIWVIVHYVNNPWRPSREFTLINWQEIMRFGRSVLGVKLMNTLRNNLDYLIAGRFLGVEALGIYYFAFNAGLGISMSAINAVDSALFPHLCAARSDPEQFKDRYFSSLKTIAWIVFPLVLLQSTLAPFYVPIIFGQKWLPAIPILILICLSAIPRPFANAASRVLWALDKPNWDLRWNAFFTAFFAIALLIGVNWGIIGVAAAVLLAHGIALPMYSIWVTRNMPKIMNQEIVAIEIKNI